MTSQSVLTIDALIGQKFPNHGQVWSEDVRLVCPLAAFGIGRGSAAAASELFVANSDHDVALLVPLVHVAVGLDNLIPRIAAVNDRPELARLG
jgi:hypothetical protein